MRYSVAVEKITNKLVKSDFPEYVKQRKEGR